MKNTSNPSRSTTKAERHRPRPQATLDSYTASIRDACRLFGVGATKMREHIRNGDIEAVVDGRNLLIILPSARAYFSSRPKWSPGVKIGTRKAA